MDSLEMNLNKVQEGRNDDHIEKQEVIGVSADINQDAEKFQEERTAYQQFEQLGEFLKKNTSSMYDVVELMKLGMDSLKNRTYHILLQNDRDYQRRLKKEQDTLKRLEKLDISKEDLDVIFTHIARKDEAEFDRITNAYIAGMLDNYEILKVFGLTKE